MESPKAPIGMRVPPLHAGHCKSSQVLTRIVSPGIGPTADSQGKAAAREFRDCEVPIASSLPQQSCSITSQIGLEVSPYGLAIATQQSRLNAPSLIICKIRSAVSRGSRDSTR